MGDKDFSSQFIDRWRGEVAASYLGRRRLIEQKIKIFEETLDNFRRHQPDIPARLGVMRYVLLTDERYAAFFSQLHLPVEQPLPPPGPYEKWHLPATLPSGWRWAAEHFL